jgi:hypothetical protein
MGKRRFAQSGRAEEQDMIKRFAPRARGGDKDFELFAYFGLSDIFHQPTGTQGAFNDVFLPVGHRGRDEAILSGRKFVDLYQGGEV